MSGTHPPRDRPRGQTTQDFAIGISLFLLTAIFVFVFLPTIFTPFDSGAAAGTQQQADRIAATIVDEYSMENRQNWLNASFSGDVVGSPGASVDDLRQRYGTEDFRFINVTLQRIDGSTIPGVQGGGTGYDGQQAGTVTRVVVVPDVEECSPGGADGRVCRLVVRVW